MMNRSTTIIFLIFTGFFLNACQKDIDIFVPDAGSLNGPDTAWYSAITSTMPIASVRSSLVIPGYTDSIQVNGSAFTLTTPFGLQCIFPPNSCVGSGGSAITGSVNVELSLLKKKGDMIRMNTPTTSNGYLLISGGEIFIRLKKENNEVHLSPGARIQFKFNDVPVNTQMRFFAGDESIPERFNWLADTSSGNYVSPNTQGYEVLTNHLHWINCDYFYNYNTSGQGLVTVNADLAPYFTNANTLAFTVFKDFRSVVGMYGDVSTRKFSCTKLPGGKAIAVVIISKQGNDYFFGYENTVTVTPTGTASVIQSVKVTPVKTSLADILHYLDTL